MRHIQSSYNFDSIHTVSICCIVIKVTISKSGLQMQNLFLNLMIIFWDNHLVQNQIIERVVYSNTLSINWFSYCIKRSSNSYLDSLDSNICMNKKFEIKVNEDAISLGYHVLICTEYIIQIKFRSIRKDKILL